METKSPLKNRPLRYPGQSLDERIDEILHDEVMPLYWGAVAIVVVVLLDWYVWLADAKIHPAWLSGLLAVYLVYLFFKVRYLISKLKRLKQGRDGERSVGQLLDRLVNSNSRVFHDVLGDGFNIDHILISDKGVYVIETKTYSKPKNGPAKITYSNDNLSFNGKILSTNEFVQAKAAAYWVHKFLKAELGKRFEVKPILLFPGWYVEEQESQVWVLNPDRLRVRLYQQKDKLERAQVMDVARTLAKYVRASSD